MRIQPQVSQMLANPNLFFLFHLVAALQLWVAYWNFVHNFLICLPLRPIRIRKWCGSDPIRIHNTGHHLINQPTLLYTVCKRLSSLLDQAISTNAWARFRDEKSVTKSAKTLKGCSPLAARLESEKLEDLLSDGGRQELLQGIRSLHQHTAQSRQWCFKSVMQSRDILVRIRIRLWIMPLSSDANKILIFSSFSPYLFFNGTFTSFFKDKKIIKKSQNSRNQGFSYYFCLMIEGSWFDNSD